LIIVIRPDYQTLSNAAADFIAAAIRANPQIVLGLPTGSTPQGMYDALVRMHREGTLDLSQVRTFNMDEYVGLSAAHPQSYHAYMKTRFFSLTNIRPENASIPNALDEAGVYEKAIQLAGGIDLQISGIGMNAHIGFNEPGSSLDSRTRTVDLADSTRSAMRQYFPDESTMPRKAITVGIATILEAKRILLIASGKRKAKAVARALEGPVSEDVPASVIQVHPDVTVMLDTEAAFFLTK
jgi:glucosamine-6-phosphate deaminase